LVSSSNLTQDDRYGAFDRPTAIAGAVILSFVGNGVFIGLPVIVGAVADSLGFNEQMLGWIASAETGGLFVAAVITSALVNRCNRRYLAAIGIMLATVANFFSSTVTEFETLFALRAVSGLGGGICYSLGVACLAGTHHTGRNYSILIFGLVFMNAVELFTIPTISDNFGVSGVYIGFAVVFGLCLPVVKWIPRFADTLDHDHPAEDDERGHDSVSGISARIPLLCLVAVFCFYITISSFWTYIERAGVASGFSDAFITNTLTVGTLFSLIGCVAAAWLSDRFGQSKPLLLALVSMVIVLLGLSLGLSAATYIVGLFLFNVLWNFTDIYQLGTIANVDRTGRFAALVPAAQHAANTIGPTAAASMFVVGWSYAGVMLLGALASVCAFLLYLTVYVRLRRIAPVVADAS
jgi:predicted MFS family arabinose efflux permease